MTDNADLIAETREGFRVAVANGWAREGDAPTLAMRLAERLEAADQRAAELAAVVEKVRHNVGDTVLYVPDEEDIDPDQESAYMEGAEHVKMRIRNTLASAPPDALREVRAEAWDEGATAASEGYDLPDAAQIHNPYREGQS